MDFEIMPYQSAGPLCFGMTQMDVTQVIGNIDRTIDSSEGIIELYNFSLDIVVQLDKKSGRLFEVGFGHRATGVRINNILLFEQPKQDVLQALLRADSNARSGHGSVVFLDLGISLTGYQSNDSMRAITAFAKGVWDDLLPSMTQFSG